MSPPSHIVTFMVVMALVLHSGLAFASPSDPTWIAGFYDGDDGDDIVILIGDEMLSDGVSVPLIPPPGKLPDSLLGPSRGDIQALHARQQTRGPPPSDHASTAGLASNSLRRDSRPPTSTGAVRRKSAISLAGSSPSAQSMLLVVMVTGYLSRTERLLLAVPLAACIEIAAELIRAGLAHGASCEEVPTPQPILSDFPPRATDPSLAPR